MTPICAPLVVKVVVTFRRWSLPTTRVQRSGCKIGYHSTDRDKGAEWPKGIPNAMLIAPAEPGSVPSFCQQGSSWPSSQFRCDSISLHGHAKFGWLQEGTANGYSRFVCFRIGLPIPEHAFFKHAVLHHQLGQQFLELVSLRPQPFDLVAGRFTRGIAGQPLLARLQEVLRPAIVKVLVDPFLAAQLGNAVLAAQARDHDPDLVLSREVPPGRPPYVAYRLLRLFRLRIDFRSHLSAPSAVIDEPKTLSYSIAINCPTCADGEHLGNELVLLGQVHQQRRVETFELAEKLLCVTTVV